MVARARTQLAVARGFFMGLLGKLVPSQIAAEVTQSVATVTADIMTPEEWAKQWAERTAHFEEP